MDDGKRPLTCPVRERDLCLRVLANLWVSFSLFYGCKIIASEFDSAEALDDAEGSVVSKTAGEVKHA